MAIESTAINDLIDQVTRKPIQRDSDDWMFGEADDATEIDPVFSAQQQAPSPLEQPFVMPPLPKAYANMAALSGSRLQTQYVRKGTDWRRIAKLAALPLSLFVIVIALMVVYFAKSASKPPTAVASATAKESRVAMPVKAEVAKPVAMATPIEPTPTATPAPTVSPTVTPIEPAAPTPEATTDVKVAPAAEVKVAPAAEVKVAPAAAAEAKAAPAAETKQPAVTVPADSPAARFLNEAPAEPTITTTRPTTPPAAAPTTVATPSVAATAPAAKAKTKAIAKPAAKRGLAKRATKRPSKFAAKIARRPTADDESDDEEAPPMKKATKKSFDDEEAPAMKKTTKKSFDDEEAPPTKKTTKSSDDEEPPAKAAAQPAKPDAGKPGKGVLSITSEPSLEVWVDGRNSNAKTPLRVILLAGKHNVTLFDKEHGKARTFEVEIKANETLKVSKSY